jgi:pilus assembly protein FimV
MVALQSGMAEKSAKPLKSPPSDQDAKPVTTSANDDLNFADDKQEAKPALEKKEDAAKPKAFVPEPIEEEFDPVAFVMENPPVIGAGLLALLLALVGINIARKRKAQQEDPVATNFQGEDPLDDVDLGNDFNDDFANMGQDTDIDLEGFDEGDLSNFDTSSNDAGLTGDIDQDISVEDIIGEADGYMSYNRPEPARTVLEKGIESQPSRMDLRLKMVEVLSAMDDQEALDEQLEFINENGSDADITAAAQLQSGNADDLVNEDFAMDFGLGDDLDITSDTSKDGFESMSTELSLDEEASDLDFDLDGLELNDTAQSETTLDLGADLDTDLSFGTSSDLDLDFSTSESTEDLDITLDEASDSSNGMDFDLSDFENSADEEVTLDDVEEPVAVELDQSLDALSLDINDSDDLDFDFSDNDSAAAVPELSATDELDDLSFETMSDDDSDDLSLDETLPEFEEGLSLDEELDLPELTDEIDSDLDSELDALASDDIELPTLESGTSSLDDLPELNDDFDISTLASADEQLEPIEDVVAEYKEELPSLDDSIDGDEFPPLGNLDDLDLDNLDNDLDFLSGTDESETKLDLARAYIDMEDQDGAREILQEVLEEGSDEQKQEATKLMDSLV